MDGLLPDFSGHGLGGSTSDHPVVVKCLHRRNTLWLHQPQTQQALLCLLAHGCNSGLYLPRRIALQYILGRDNHLLGTLWTLLRRTIRINEHSHPHLPRQSASSATILKWNECHHLPRRRLRHVLLRHQSVVASLLGGIRDKPRSRLLLWSRHTPALSRNVPRPHKKRSQGIS
jgi:hypothetical protein